MPVPDAAAEVEEPELCDVVDRNVDAAAALVRAVRRPVPAHVGDPEGHEELPREEIEQLHPGELFDDMGEHERRACVVGEVRPRLVGDRLFHEGADLVLRADHAGHRAAAVARVHREDVPDLHFEKILLRVLRYVVREEIDEAGVKGEFALVDEEPDGGRAEGLREGIDLPLVRAGIRRRRDPEDRSPAAEDLDSMNLVLPRFEVGEEFVHRVP